LDPYSEKVIMTQVALVCIAKNEDKYIDEWIRYNFKLGFNSIYIYANDWEFSYDHPNVTIFNISGIQQQVPAYNHFIHQFNWKYDWAAFFDVDEFLVLKKHKNIQELLSDYADHPALGINWYFFGSNGHEKVSDDHSVLNRFTKRQSVPNKHIKTIAKLPCSHMVDVHNLMHCDWVDTNKNPHSGPFNEDLVTDVAHINHYFTKSKEEFINKVNRGRADTHYKRDMSEYDEEKNWNEVEDLSAYNFYYNI